MSDEQEPHPSRTVLEQLIRERRETFEEFARFATNFARDCGEPGTLSSRHLKRLASGRGDGGKPLGRPQQATVRLLERIFGVSIDELLSSPRERRSSAEDDGEFRTLLRTSSAATASSHSTGVAAAARTAPRPATRSPATPPTSPR
ncbi:hypothetical protein QRX60_50300 [Amycolatopsis mongoliensis]|uniref:Uncharacterized protein n=1 Tax=Amycolatopsis mongoliensis TaxID=715475 RepID=A0A9Y2NLC7_9PSEU|nr:hypothetical protein [Amycolatopsis sp. 4-36]WIY02100.1 hypothetical protein QRX60_50300 [Amycolatopsis sp. 4-36]